MAGNAVSTAVKRGTSAKGGRKKDSRKKDSKKKDRTENMEEII